MDHVSRPLRLGTRRSALARTQSAWVAARLAALGAPCELTEVITEGDVNQAPLTQIGGTGVFASALRQALLAGEIDLAVHSLKDLPVAPEPGLVVAAIPEREDVRDVLIAADPGVRSLADLPPGAVLGTGSPRRAAQLRQARPDLRCQPIRGNVGTRIGRVTRGELDGVVLAGAGLRRLGLTSQISGYLSTEVMLPAAGQGALAVECRADDERTVQVLAAIDDPATRVCVELERELLAALEAGCTAPVGAYARIVDASGCPHEAPGRGDEAESSGADGALIHLDAFAGTSQAGLRVHVRRPRAHAGGLGRATAEQMLSRLDSEGARIATPEDM